MKEEESYLEIGIGPFCDKDCIFCNEGGYGKRPFMGLELFTKFIKETKLKKIALSGGEPIYNKDFTKYISICKKYNKKVSLVTAWTTNNKEYFLDLLLKEDLDELMISIEGPKIIHDKLVKKDGAFESILWLIDKLNKRRYLGKRTPRVILHSNLNKINYKILPKFIDKMLNNFEIIEVYHIQALEPLGNAIKNKDILFLKYSDLLEPFFLYSGNIRNIKKIHIGRIPHCVFPEHLQYLISNTPDIYNGDNNCIEEDLFYKESKYDSNECKKCLKYDECEKFFINYLEQFGKGEIKIII